MGVYKCAECSEKHEVGYGCEFAPDDEPGADTESDIAALKDWWVDDAALAIGAIAPKAVEYSSQDLADLGRDMAEMLGLDHFSSVEEFTELGIYFYLIGKFARWKGAIKEKRRPSDDTIFDIKVYATMAQRNRAVGGWPFAPTEENR